MDIFLVGCMFDADTADEEAHWLGSVPSLEVGRVWEGPLSLSWSTGCETGLYPQIEVNADGLWSQEARLEPRVCWPG